MFSQYFHNLIINTAGQSSQVCQPAVRYRRNNGAPHWLLSHQCGGDSLLHGQDYRCPHESEEKMNNGN